MNPMKLLQLKSAWDRVKVTTPEGEELSANLRLKEDDIALFQEITELFQ